ncbi:MAG: hypothetical protein ACI8PZ_000322 [Myxococcota bacterium]
MSNEDASLPPRRGPDSTVATLGLLSAFGGSFSVTTLVVLATWFGAVRPTAPPEPAPTMMAAARVPAPSPRTVPVMPARTTDLTSATSVEDDDAAEDDASAEDESTDVDSEDADADGTADAGVEATSGSAAVPAGPKKPASAATAAAKPAPAKPTPAKPTPAKPTPAKPAPAKPAPAKPAPAKPAPAKPAPAKPAPAKPAATADIDARKERPPAGDDGEAVVSLGGEVRLSEPEAEGDDAVATAGVPVLKPRVPPGARALDGQYSGRAGGKPLTITFRFGAADVVSGEAQLTTGGKASAHRMSGTYVMGPDGSATIVLMQEDDNAPWVYSGNVTPSGEASGRITEGGKDRGKFNARR